MRFIAVALACLVAFHSADAATSGVDARLESAELVLTNTTRDALYYAVFGREELTRIEWVITCTDDNRLPARGSVRLHLDRHSVRWGDEAVVFWWRGCEESPTRIQSLTLFLR